MATPPLTGRNLFIGTITRWHALGIPGTPSPVHHTSTTRLYNVQLIAVDADPPTCMLSWSYTGAADAHLAIYALATYSNRESPKPNKLVIVSNAPINVGFAYFPLKCAATTVHIRLQLVDKTNGQVIHSTLYKFHPVWP